MQFKREPALWLALIGSVISMVSAFVFPLTDEQQGVLNALAFAATGLITAIMVKSDAMAPAILGLVKAALAVGLAFGWHLAPENQAVIMTFAAAITGMFVRTQVLAPVGTDLQPVQPRESA